jgi:BMFP domain-containing protein YqiC
MYLPSSRRYKEDIQDMDEASTGLLRLRPVTFRYKKPYADGSKPLNYGLIAEEVAEIYPDLVVKDAEGQVQTVEYQKLTPMLLNEVQKEHFETQRLKAELQRQQEHNHRLEARLAALEALLSTKAPANSSAPDQQ